MFYEVVAKRAIRLNPQPDTELSLSEQAQLGLLRQGITRRGIQDGTSGVRLGPGITPIGPRFGNVLYHAEISEDETIGLLVTSLSQRAIAARIGYGGILPTTFTPELTREIIRPNTFIPLAEKKIDWWASARAMSWRRVIRARHFVANISPSHGDSPASVTPPFPRVPQTV